VGAFEIGEGQIVKILFGDQHRHPLIIDVEKILQVAELIGSSQRFHRRISKRDAVAPRQREHQLGLQAALDMNVELAFRQPLDQRVEHFEVTEAS